MIWIDNKASRAFPRNDFSWVACDGGIVWGIFNHHGACPNRDIVTDGYILHQEHTRPQIHVITYMSSLVMIGPDIALMTDVEIIPNNRARGNSYTHKMRDIKPVTNSSMPIDIDQVFF